jgi:predicted  nucleic acid-binding Zn-ribbon protein
MPGIQGDVPMQQRALPSAIDDLQRAITTLEGTIDNLHSQLHPVLDEPTELKDSAANGVAQSTRYSSQINDVVSRIRELNRRGVDLLQRLHV